MTVPSLRQQIDSGNKREAVIDDALGVLDAEVADKSGLSGIAVKGAFKLVKGIQPGFIRTVVDKLLNDFLDALDPIYQEAMRSGVAPHQHLKANAGRVADALLGITDARAERAERQVIKKTYEKLRPSARKHVEAAAPRLADLLERHAQTEA